LTFVCGPLFIWQNPLTRFRCILKWFTSFKARKLLV
jgi:hypothetical protein